MMCFSAGETTAIRTESSAVTNQCACLLIREPGANPRIGSCTVAAAALSAAMAKSFLACLMSFTGSVLRLGPTEHGAIDRCVRPPQRHHQYRETCRRAHSVNA